MRLGCRASLLAVAQSRQVANALEMAHPGLRVKLVTQSTRGDQDQQTPLQQVQDPDFFSAELDALLAKGDIDCVVHSAKDLAAARPAEFYRAAVPVRENPRDMVVFRADVMEKLRRGISLRVGCSSLRRSTHSGAFLREHLPQFARPPQLEFLPLRGTVDGRLQRILLPDSDPDALDAVVLALAGLARLWRDAAGCNAIEDALAASPKMVLPLTHCPTAPGQGALSLECRRMDVRTQALLRPLHDPATAKRLEDEIAAAIRVNNQPAFGATTIRNPHLGRVTFTRDASGRRKVLWAKPPPPKMAKAWCGKLDSTALEIQRININQQLGPAIFIAHWRALPDGFVASDAHRLWVSGTTSWRKLALRGRWIEGCAENFGFEHLVPTLQSEVLQLPHLAEWTALTHADAVESWAGSGIAQVVASYTASFPNAADTDQDMRAATHCYWHSPRQFDALHHSTAKDAEHACGAGKTAAALKSMGIKPTIFPSQREWQAWLS